MRMSVFDFFGLSQMPLIGSLGNFPGSLLAAQAETVPQRKVTTWDYHSPALWEGTDWLLAAAFLLAIVYVIFLYIRDTRAIASRFKPLYCLWMTSLRVGVLLGLLAIFLNPHQRTQTQAYRPSQVVFLIDTSASMEQPADNVSGAKAAQARSRTEAIREALVRSPLIETLRKTHHVDIYTFDTDVSENHHRFLTRQATPETPAEDSTADTASDDIDWDAVLRPRGLATRLGDSLDKLLAEVKSSSLSGVVVWTDGANNSGRDVLAANTRAKQDGTRLFTVGVGSTIPPLNLEVVRIIAPTEVQLGDPPDPFDLTAIVKSSGLLRGNALPGTTKTVKVELLRKGPNDAEPAVIDAADAAFTDDGQPVPVVFECLPEDVGEVEYSARIVSTGMIESRLDDNLKTRTVSIYDQPLKVLIIAGGPMRDYRFAKNALHRHKSIEVDVWLQTGTPGISQDANQLLFEFPSTREELFAYHVVIAFDPDWSQIPEESRKNLEDFVTDFGGGIILVAGDVYTPQLAAIDPNSEPEYQPILNLYPVILDEIGLQLGTRNDAFEAYPVGLTQAGKAAAFLQLTEDPADAPEVWEEFPGIYRCYPTRGRKGGTTVYAEFTDPLGRGPDGQYVLLAGQRYGQGSGIYLGSPEVWRLRSLDEDFYDRFWTKLIRKAAEGRLKRGEERVVLILEGRDYEVGQTVPIRARVVDVSYKPIQEPQLNLLVTDPNGRPILPPPVLEQDRNRPEEFFGTLRVSIPGRYQLRLESPGSTDEALAEIDVVIPRLEASDPLQNVSLLENLAAGTGGRYLTVDEAAETLPAALPNMGHEFILDQRIQELWDEKWVMILLGTLLALEWLTRKLLKLA